MKFHHFFSSNRRGESPGIEFVGWQAAHGGISGVADPVNFVGHVAGRAELAWLAERERPAFKLRQQQRCHYSPCQRQLKLRLLLQHAEPRAALLQLAHHYYGSRSGFEPLYTHGVQSPKECPNWHSNTLSPCSLISDHFWLLHWWRNCSFIDSFF